MYKRQILISAYGLQKKAFVAVDVVYAMFPVRVQHILHIVTYAIFLVPFLMGLVPASWTFFLNAYTTGEQTYSVWAAPTWPVKLCLFVGLVLLAIQAVSEILKHVEGLVTASANGKEAQGGLRFWNNCRGWSQPLRSPPARLAWR